MAAGDVFVVEPAAELDLVQLRVAPTALGLFGRFFPRLTPWAKVCRAAGAQGVFLYGFQLQWPPVYAGGNFF
jgi:hypothetical protein